MKVVKYDGKPRRTIQTPNNGTLQDRVAYLILQPLVSNIGFIGVRINGPCTMPGTFFSRNVRTDHRLLILILEADSIYDGFLYFFET